MAYVRVVDPEAGSSVKRVVVSNLDLPGQVVIDIDHDGRIRGFLPASSPQRWFALTPVGSIVRDVAEPSAGWRLVRGSTSSLARRDHAEGGAQRSRAARATAIFITGRREPRIGWKLWRR